MEGASPLLVRLGSDGTPRTVEELFAGFKEVLPDVAAGVHRLDEQEAGRLLTEVDDRLRHIGRSVADLDVVEGEGRVTGVYLSDGGVPKLPVERAAVGVRGVEGDRQASRRHHGKPMQALCLYSAEVIGALREEGHPISPGSTGENVVLRGLEWSSLRPFLRLRVGSVLAELSAPATPCDKNARWFIGGDYDRMNHDLHPGWSRWYAWVLEPGEIAVGDTAQLAR